MKKLRKNEDLYFYKGKFYTELGLKRALAKDGELTYSRGTFYLYEKYFEYYYSYNEFRDRLHDYNYITDEEYKHFKKWLNKKVADKEVQVLKNHTFYHCDATDGIGDEWDYILESLRDFGTSEENRIQTDEEVIEDYCQTLSEEEFKKFCQLPDLKQFNIASKWAIETYNKRQGA